MNNVLIFGQRYIINGMMRKYHHSIGGGMSTTEWNRNGFKSGEALFIGYRTLYNGTIHHYKDEQSYFAPTETLKACLFVINGHRNPIYVHPEDVQS